MKTDTLIEMLRWKRPSGSDDYSTYMFARTYLEPVFGKPDVNGNYVKIINTSDGDTPTVCFTAHYDTVHTSGGFQDVTVTEGGFVTLADGEESNCLGADCTTGIWLILGMIEACVSGIYVIHADEESGCIGSSSLIKDGPEWLYHIDSVISFDRYGEKSVITHQCSMRTASDAFAKSLAAILKMPNLVPDPNGVYTDSNEYRDIVPECTNLSVGYYSQHSNKESQNLIFAEGLLDALINADWSKLVIERDPSAKEYDSYTFGYGRPSDDDYYYYKKDHERDALDRYWAEEDLKELFSRYPQELAEYFYERDVTAEELAYEVGIQYGYRSERGVV